MPNETEINFIIYVYLNWKLSNGITTDVFWPKKHFLLSKSIIWGPFFSAQMPIRKRNRNGNLGKLIDLSSVSTHYSHCNVWIGNHLNIKHSDHVHMTPHQFAFSDQLCTTFARKMTFTLRSIFAHESNATFTYGVWGDSYASTTSQATLFSKPFHSWWHANVLINLYMCIFS